jgi:hypothetical protein
MRIGVRVDCLQVLVLESRPLLSHAPLENLPPSERGLFVYELVEGNWVFVFVECCFVEPGIDAIQESISTKYDRVSSRSQVARRALYKW